MTDCTNPVANSKFLQMKTGMLLHTPFFASLMLDMMTLKVGKFPGIDTAGTNGRTLWMDEDFVAGNALEENVFVCCHEVAHAMWHHMDRGRRWMDLGFEGKPFSPALYNIAADYVINDMLKKCKVGRMPKCGLHDPQFTGDMLVEDVYRMLYKQNPPTKATIKVGSASGQQAPDGSGSGAPNNDGVNGKSPLDTHVYDQAQVSEAEMKRAIATAVQQAKVMGRMPAELDRWVSEVLAPQVNWKERLRTLVTRISARDTTTWTSPNRRRLVSQKIYYPKPTGYGAGEIVCVVDTSCSMGEREFNAAWAEFSDIIMNCRPEKVWLMSCDADVHDVHELPSYYDIYGARPSMKGGGGTDFKPPFEKVEELGVTPALLVYFTDGHGSFPDDPPRYPVIWVMTTDQEAPFGEVVRVEMDKYDK